MSRVICGSRALGRSFIVSTSKDSTRLFGHTFFPLSRVSLINASFTIQQEHAGIRVLSSQDTAASQSDELRTLMRLVPHPVAIITSTKSSSEGTIDCHWRGATVSSFNTVTFTPDPVVSFNIKRQSATFKAIESSSTFNVHLLAETKEAERLADRFAGGNDARPFHNDEGELQHFVTSPDDIDETGLSNDGEGETGRGVLPPTIRFAAHDSGKQHLSFRIRCQYLASKTVDVGDHVVVFGKATAVLRDPHQSSKNKSRPALVYVDRGYGRVSR